MSLTLPPSAQTPAAQALTLGYPGVVVSPDGSALVIGETVIDFGEMRDVSPSERLANASLAEQFHYPYPIQFDLAPRREPFADPGRLRNNDFFKALYFSSEGSARASLVRVEGAGPARAEFWMTEKWGVSCQLAAALDEISQSGDDVAPFFRQIGGSFNWRRISGTSRLSTHSFGISIDINAQLGQYWKWTGAREGAVIEYENKVPESIVTALERYGFIWGGKWHHFDGMHFEYRPELILYSRIIEQY